MIYLLGMLTIGVIYAALFIAPPIAGLGEVARIALFHIPVAWVSVIAFLLSAFWAWLYLKKGDFRSDTLSAKSALLGFIFAVLATLSGAYFAHLTWGSWWNWDPRQTTILVLLLIYSAYLVLRQSLPDERKRARLSAIYSLFSAITVPFLVFVIPRFYFSLHPSPIISGSNKIMMDEVFLGVLIASTVNMTLIFLWLLFRTKKRAL